MPQTNGRLCDIYTVEEEHFLLSKGPDLISGRLRQGERWEPGTIETSKRLIFGKTAPVVVDIGANLGAWSVPIGKYISATGGKLFAFEPQRPVFYQLCANIFANNIFNCFAHNLALGDYCGRVEIPLLDVHSCNNLGALSISASIREEQGWIKSPKTFEEVCITTLDALSLPKADLVKIDVEGLELEVISGGREWLQQSNYPPLLFEVWGDYMENMIAKREKLFSLVINELGYEVSQRGELCIAQHKART